MRWVALTTGCESLKRATASRSQSSASGLITTVNSAGGWLRINWLTPTTIAATSTNNITITVPALIQMSCSRIRARLVHELPLHRLCRGTSGYAHNLVYPDNRRCAPLIIEDAGWRVLQTLEKGPQ